MRFRKSSEKRHKISRTAAKNKYMLEKSVFVNFVENVGSLEPQKRKQMTYSKTKVESKVRNLDRLSNFSHKINKNKHRKIVGMQPKFFCDITNSSRWTCAKFKHFGALHVKLKSLKYESLGHIGQTQLDFQGSVAK